MASNLRFDSLLLLCLLSSLTAPSHAVPEDPFELFTPTTSTSTSTSTSSIDALITQPAVLHPRAIATCAYISGNAASPLTCPAGYDCISTVQDVVGWACCDAIQCLGNYRTCADFGAGLCGGDGLGGGDCSAIYTSILSCSDTAAPSCFLYARSTALGDQDIRYSYACGASGGSVLALATTTGPDGGVGAAASSSSTTDYFPTAASTDNFAGASPSASTPTSALSPDSPSSSSAGPNNGLNTGSLIGIIIAAVGTFATIAGAYFAWKAVQKRRDRNPGRSRAMGQDGVGQYSTVRPSYGHAPGIYSAPRPAYGAPPSYGNSYGGQMYPNNGWR